MSSQMPWQKIPKPPKFAPAAPKVVQAPKVPKVPKVPTSNAGGLTAAQKISLAAGRRATRQAFVAANRRQIRTVRLHGQQVRSSIRSKNKTANAGYRTRVRAGAAAMKSRLAVARNSVNALPAKAKIAVTSSEAAMQNFSNKVRLVDPDYIDLGKDGSKWKHGFIPLNPAAVALKAHRTPGGGGTTKVHVGGKYVGNVRVLTGKRGRKTHVATAPIGPNVTATHHASHAEAVAAIKARSGTHDPNLPAANATMARLSHRVGDHIEFPGTQAGKPVTIPGRIVDHPMSRQVGGKFVKVQLKNHPERAVDVRRSNITKNHEAEQRATGKDAFGRALKRKK